MKKKLGIMILLLISALMCVSCGNQQQLGTPVRIYYLDSSEMHMKDEIHYIQSNITKEQIVEVLTLLSDAPENKELKATISGGVNIVNFSFDNNQVTVSLGAKYLDLPKTSRILVRAAIVKSLTQFQDVDAVLLTIEGEPLLEEDGTVVGLMTGDMFIEKDTGKMSDYEVVTIRLYFTNEDGNILVPIDRSLLHNLDMSNVSMEKLVVEQLLAGPANEESWPTINPATKLLGVTLKDGICYLNFDSSILTPVNNVTSDVVLYSIANSLIELNGVNKVQISIDGKKDIKFRDKYDLSTLFEMNQELIAQ